MSKKKPPTFAGEPGPLLHTARWRLGEFELDEGKRELSHAGVVLPLEPKPLNMLMLMLRHPGELITKNDLMEALWTGRIVTETVLSNSVAKLRNALGDEDCRAIRTVHGYGYRLEGNPELITEAPAVQAPEVSFEADSPVPLRPNWRLRRRLGRSGECWLAEQPMTGELRVFKFAYQPKALSALKREVTLYRLLRQTLEDRAPILDLLDWNFDEPPWFIETEYCELGSLQEYLEAQGGAASLPLDKRLGIVIQIAEALAAVHALGILHKDLKPANVLISPAREGEVRIRLADFGSGRLLDYARLESLAITRLGFSQFADPSGSGTSGTPLYYAPEVLSGQPVTLKADVYALGVILYQLVVGDMRRLFAPGWEAGVADELLREDIAVAAAGDPYLRLADAQLLAQRLRQVPARRSERAQQRAERETAAATALALQRADARRAGLLIAAGAMALGLVTSLALYWQAALARAEAESSTETANSIRNFLLKDVLQEISNGIRPAQPLTVRQLLDTAAANAGSRFAKRPEVEAAVREELGQAYFQLGLSTVGKRQLEKALAEYIQLEGMGSAHTAAVAASMILLDYTDGVLPGRMHRYEQIADAAIKNLGPEHPQVIQLRWKIASGYYTLGLWLAAEQKLSQLTNITDAPDFSNLRVRYLINATQAYNRLALDDIAGAEKLIGRSISGIKALYGNNHYEISKMGLLLAWVYIRTERFNEAEIEIKNAEEIAKLWEKHPGSLFITAATHRARLELSRGHLDQSAYWIRHTEMLMGESLEDTPTAADQLLTIKAKIEQLQNHHEQSLAYFEEALAAGGQYMPPAHPELQRLRLEIAEEQIILNKTSAAKTTLGLVDEAVIQSLPTNHGIRTLYKELKAKI